MKKRIIALILSISIILCLCGCKKESGTSSTNKPVISFQRNDSTFSIQFIDVGQGDSALVECDGHYMLIDGGDKAAGDKVYSVLKEQGIRKLDILVASHLHSDHIGGLIKALTYASDIGLTISNSTYYDSDVFRDFEHELCINGSKIEVPASGEKYKLGSATVEVIDSGNKEENDSLVLLLTYKKTTFLFTGDMEQKQESIICDQYGDDAWDVSVIKVAHHGSNTSTSIRFLRMIMPKYAVISVGEKNNFGQPSIETIDRLEQADVQKIYRTDYDGDIIVKSNGKEISIESSK